MRFLIKNTKNLNRLQESIHQPEIEVKGRSSTSKLQNLTIFSPDFIFYNKEGLKIIKQKGVWITEKISKFVLLEEWMYNLQQKREEIASSSNAVHRFWLLSSQFYKSCHAIIVLETCSIVHCEEHNTQITLQATHLQDFNSVCNVIDILKEKQIIHPSDLKL